MSVLMEYSMFPLEGEGSKSAYVAKIIKLVQNSGYPYKLTPMSTIVETETMNEALKLLEYSYVQLEECERVYVCVKFDIRQNREDGMHQKIASIQEKLDEPVHT